MEEPQKQNVILPGFNNRNNQVPIIEMRKKHSQRSLYSQNENDDSPEINSKKIIENKQLMKQKDQESKNKNKQLSQERLQRLQKDHKKIENNHNYRYQQDKSQNNQNLANHQSIHTYQDPLSLQKQFYQANQKQFIRSSNIQTSQLRHEYRNYKSELNSPKQLLKFHQFPLRSQETFAENTLLNFNKKQWSSVQFQGSSLNPNSPITQDLRNRSLRSSQGGRWLRSQSYMHQSATKPPTLTPSQQLIKHYHKHGSKYANLINSYMQILSSSQSMLNRNFNISLLNPFEDIKLNLQMYLENTIKLQNLPIDKPSPEWTQAELTKFFTNYLPIYLDQEVISSEKKRLTLKKYKNCVFFGNIVEGKKQGEGLIFYFNGKIFEGVFRHDQKIHGLEITENQQEIYLGAFQNGLRSGKGFVKTQEAFVWGQWTNGQLTQATTGNDNFSRQDDHISLNRPPLGNSFTSQPQDPPNPLSTQKTITFKLTPTMLTITSSSITITKTPINDLYLGHLSPTNQKSPFGLEIFPNGDLYIGHYEHNTPEGYGEYYWSTGAHYRGEFMSGMRHGKGKWQMLHGDQYEGEYMNDKKNGNGQYRWKNGSVYNGMFQNDYRHGYGEMKWNDGRTYKGHWVNGIEKNVHIKLDKGIDKSIKNPGIANKTLGTSINTIQNPKKPTQPAKRPFLPGVTKKTYRSVSNPNTKQSFHTIDSSFPVNKKITIQNIKALYNPSNH